MNTDVPKQLLELKNESILESSIRKFHEHPGIDEIFIVSHPDLMEITRKMVEDKEYFKVSKILPGGTTRQSSSEKGVTASEGEHRKILIHDSARPYVSPGMIARVLSALDHADAVTPVIDSSDTLVCVDQKRYVNRYLERDNIKRVQTPQGFNRQTIVNAHRMAAAQSMSTFTDDCSMVIHFGLSEVMLVDGDPLNIKITYKEDLRGNGVESRGDHDQKM